MFDHLQGERCVLVRPPPVRRHDHEICLQRLSNGENRARDRPLGYERFDGHFGRDAGETLLHLLVDRFRRLALVVRVPHPPDARARPQRVPVVMEDELAAERAAEISSDVDLSGRGRREVDGTQNGSEHDHASPPQLGQRNRRTEARGNSSNSSASAKCAECCVRMVEGARPCSNSMRGRARVRPRSAHRTNACRGASPPRRALP